MQINLNSKHRRSLSDVTDICENNWDTALAMTKNLQSEIMDTLGLSTSFGIGSTRILAKMGSEENKPEEYIEHFLMKLDPFENRPVREARYWSKTATRLAEWGINTMSEVSEYGEIAISLFTSERFVYADASHRW